MLENTIRLFIKALIIGVLINLGLQYIAPSPLSQSENTALHKPVPDQVPTNAEFQVTRQTEE